MWNSNIYANPYGSAVSVSAPASDVQWNGTGSQQQYSAYQQQQQQYYQQQQPQPQVAGAWSATPTAAQQAVWQQQQSQQAWAAYHQQQAWAAQQAAQQQSWAVPSASASLPSFASSPLPSLVDSLPSLVNPLPSLTKPIPLPAASPSPAASSAPSLIQIQQAQKVQQQQKAKSAATVAPAAAASSSGGGWPASLRSYVERCFKAATTPQLRQFAEKHMTEVIQKANIEGTVLTKKWELEELPPALRGSQIVMEWTAINQKSDGSKAAAAASASSSSSAAGPSVPASKRKEVPQSEPEKKESNKSAKKKKKELLQQLQAEAAATAAAAKPKKSKSALLDSALSEEMVSSLLAEQSDKRVSRTARFDVSNSMLSRFEAASAMADQKGKNGFLASASTPAKISDSIVGRCVDMCPPAERARRTDERRLSVLELTPECLADRSLAQETAAEYAVKEFARSAAAQVYLPQDIRPPSVLRRSLNYLISKCIDRNDVDYLDVHDFMYNRLRAIGIDYGLQSIKSPERVHSHECTVRFHVIGLFLLSTNPTAIMAKGIYLEQLSNNLTTLHALYEELRRQGYSCPNEPEMLSYDVLLRMEGNDIQARLGSVPSSILSSPHVQFALQVRSAYSSGNYIRFFRLLQQASFLESCLMHQHFAKVRQQAIQVITKSFASRAIPSVSLSLEEVLPMLAFDSQEEAVAFCTAYGWEWDRKKASFQVNFNSFEVPSTAPAPHVSDLIIAKAKGTSRSKIMTGSAGNRPSCSSSSSSSKK